MHSQISALHVSVWERLYGYYRFVLSIFATQIRRSHYSLRRGLANTVMCGRELGASGSG
jgi:hypothetical protein